MDIDPATLAKYLRMVNPIEGGKGALDTLATFAGQAATQVPAGLAGLGKWATTGDPMAGADTVNAVQDKYGYKPMTEQGQQAMGQLGEGIKTIEGLVPEPVKRGYERAALASPVGAAMLEGGAAVLDPTKGAERGAATLARAARSATRGVEDVGKTAQVLREAPKGYDPLEMAIRYPEPGKPELVTDPKSGKQYLAKTLSAEGLAVDKVRKQAMADIKEGSYQPYFDVSQREHVDPANYPLQGATITEALPKKQATIDQYQARFSTPEARARLLQAYDEGAKDPLAHNWYAMKQLEGEFIKEHGPELGPQKFREYFSNPMAATTGGADPTANLLMGQYGVFHREQGLPIAEHAYELPTPIGGRYAMGNIEQFNKLGPQGFDPSQNPKRHNFASNFEGHLDRPTLDEQMSHGFEPGLVSPPGQSYGVMESELNKLAAQRNTTPVGFQDVAWKGLKGVPGKPMIQHVNEAIYRTSQVTGLPQAEVVKRYVRGEIPLYGIGMATGVGATLASQLRNDAAETQ